MQLKHIKFLHNGIARSIIGISLALTLGLGFASPALADSTVSPTYYTSFYLAYNTGYGWQWSGWQYTTLFSVNYSNYNRYLNQLTYYNVGGIREAEDQFFNVYGSHWEVTTTTNKFTDNDGDSYTIDQSSLSPYSTISPTGSPPWFGGDISGDWLLSNDGSAAVTAQTTWYIQGLSGDFTPSGGYPSPISWTF